MISKEFLVGKMSEVLKVKLQRKVCLVCMMIRCTSRGLYSKHYFR